MVGRTNEGEAVMAFCTYIHRLASTTAQ